MTVQIIDASRHQGAPDWNAVRRSGVSAVILKATEGTSYAQDVWFKRERPRAEAAGLAVMAYHFANPAKDPIAQAAYFVKITGPIVPNRTLGLPTHWLDLESGDGDQTGFTLKFLHEVERLTGSTPGFYSYAPHIDGHISGKAAGLTRFPLWLAAYRSKLPQAPPPWSTVALWQYTSTGSVPGIEGHVDCNTLTQGGIPKGTPTPAAKPLPAPVVIVALGSVEEALLKSYPALFGPLPIRSVHPDPTKGVHAAANPDDIAFGIPIWGAKRQFVGKDRYETLRLAVKGS